MEQRQGTALHRQSPGCCSHNRNEFTGLICRRPRLSKEAIAAGLEAYQASRFEEAIGYFNQALELPGAGAYRLSGMSPTFNCDEHQRHICHSPHAV